MSNAASLATKKRSPLQTLVSGSIPRIPLTHREFAEKYVVLDGSGPYRNAKFRVSRQPFAGVLFDALDCGRWNTFVIAGPSQSGKTLTAFVIPLLRDVVELRETSIMAVPEAKMAADKWAVDVLPTLQASPELEWLIPRKGPGSRKGRIRDLVTLENGSEIKIISRGGKDTAKAGFTSAKLRATEAAGFSTQTATSKETQPLGQLKARLRSLKRTDPRRQITVEGTLTDKTQLPWTARGEDDDEMLISTRSRLVFPCPHCPEWISPERHHLIGWRGALTEDEAANGAAWQCPECGSAMTDDERRGAMADIRLVHWGQTLDEQGELVGPYPPVSTLWFHYQAVHNCLLDAADQAVEEWLLHRELEGTQEREDKEKENCQFVFSVPYVPTYQNEEELSDVRIRKRTDTINRGLLHDDCLFVTVGVDWGKWTGWYFAIEFRECGRLHVPAYGAFEVCTSGNEDIESAIFAAFNTFHEETIGDGYMTPDGELVMPKLFWHDFGYHPDDVAAGIVRTGSRLKGPIVGAVGRGVSTSNGAYRQPLKPTTETPLVGVNWYGKWDVKRRCAVRTFNADYWKLWVQARVRGNKEQKGGMTFFRAGSTNEHAKLAKHLVSEQFKPELTGGNWEKSGANHWLDCAAMASAAGNEAGFLLREIPEAEQQEETETDSDNWCARMLNELSGQ